ncbi:MAG: hypothetical protein M1824_001402 [Vezdaea acicularis]|nr:MAG: hypothetical protein M1824_001402 [Vezdaea acicularis]
MPPQPGEELLLTLSPKQRPPHHRFDKGSYVYLYHNPHQDIVKLEVANNAGTPDQDAFYGQDWHADLDGTFIEYSYKHDTLFTLSVEGRPLSFERGQSPNSYERSQWLLPGPDEHNQGRYMQKLNTLDIYFWTKEDATQFLEALKKLLPEHQMRILNAPVPPPLHNDHMSSVVQKLENAAISNPTYGRQHPRSGSVSATSSHHSPNLSKVLETRGFESNKTPEEPPSFAPMAYNPAAPPAPEPIKHREKTPPPPELEGGTGLMAAATHDNVPQFSAPPLQHSSTFAGPPSNAYNQPGYGGGLRQQQAFTGPPLHSQSYTGPPQPSGGHQSPVPAPGHMQRSATTSFDAPPVNSSPQPPRAPQYGQPYGYTSPPPNQSFGPPPTAAQPAPERTSTMSQLSQHSQHSQHSPNQYGTQYSTPPPPQQGYTAPPPQVKHPGYSNYSYEQNQALPADQQYAMHQQVYRPTEAELLAHGKAHKSKPPPDLSSPTGRLEAVSGRTEKKIGGLFKKLEKKIG